MFDNMACVHCSYHVKKTYMPYLIASLQEKFGAICR